MEKNSVLIPLHIFNADIEKTIQKLHENLLAFIDVADFYIVASSEIIKNLGKFSNLFKFIENNTNDLGIQNQLNIGFSKIENEFITYLEFDDILLPNFFETLEIYQNSKNIDMYLPLQMRLDYQKPENFMGFCNEVCWSRSLMVLANEDDANILEKEIDGELKLEYFLKPYIFNISLSGFTIKKSVFEKVGGFKKNIPFSFMFEFLLRVLYKSYTVQCTNKLNYVHYLNRPNSFDNEYGISIMGYEEKQYYLELAKKEYKYEPTAERPLLALYKENIK